MIRSGIILLLLAGAGCSSYPEALKHPVPGWFKPAFDVLDIGLPAPDFTLNDLAGLPWRLSDERGKVIVLTFASNSDPSYISALAAFEKEVIRPFAEEPDVLFVTVYSQESHPELAGGKWNPTVIIPGSADERRVAASQPEYRIRFRFNGKKYDLAAGRPTGANCVTLLDGIDNTGEPITGKLYGYGRGGTTNPVFLVNRRGRLALKSIWLKDLPSVANHRRGNLADEIARALKAD